MEPLKVVVENLPASKHWLIEWAPILVALAAFCVSITSLYWSRIQYRASSRPYVWLIDFATLNEQRILVNHPEVVALRVMNAPAAIIKTNYKFYVVSGTSERVIHSSQETDFVRFPDPNSQATYTFPAFNKAIQECEPGDTPKRYLRIEYSSLSIGKTYYYESVSTYDFSEQRWRVNTEKAS